MTTSRITASGETLQSPDTAAYMRDLQCWPLSERRRIVGVFTDIDDTLTTDGAITADALAALHALRDAGLVVIPITGRPVGWSETFAMTWPVRAVVAENGAVALLPLQDAAAKVSEQAPEESSEAKYANEKSRSAISDGRLQLSKIYQQTACERAENFARMQQVAARVLREIPGTSISRDSPGRETDIAIDHSEFAQLAPSTIDRVVALLRGEGMHATVSSIHINGWFGEHDKLSGARWILRTLLGRDLDAEIDRWVYVGDSTNDQTMFGAFPHSVGVANIARFVPQLAVLPRYVTQGERGAGFAQVTQALLQARQRGAG